MQKILSETSGKSSYSTINFRITPRQYVPSKRIKIHCESETVSIENEQFEREDPEIVTDSAHNTSDTQTASEEDEEYDQLCTAMELLSLPQKAFVLKNIE